MATGKKRIAIVGGGLSGIGSIVALKEEGHEPVCFEATGNIGGTWCYREKAIEGYASIMPTTVTTHSKELGAFSNFPPRKEFHNFMRHQEILQSIIDYSNHNDCERFIQFNTEVMLVKKSHDYNITGQFSVTVKDRITGKERTNIFDGVIIASGLFNYPKFATFPAQSEFKGNIRHTHSLKYIDMFRDKKVLIVGMGCSGLDAAEMISTVAKKVYISTRSGGYIFSRHGPHGYPSDYVMLRRYMLQFLSIIPINVCSWFIETFYFDQMFDHQLYPVQPQHHFLSKDPLINDAISSKLLSGSVLQKEDIVRFTEDGVVFEGEDTVTELDDVIMATGYDFKFPFLEKGLLSTEEDVIRLYKCMYPVNLPHKSLVFIRFIIPYGPIIPTGEMQCRFAAQVFSGKIKLPEAEKMLDDVIKRHRENELRYAPSSIQSVRVDFLQYNDDLASVIGCKPNLLKYLFTDFQLFLRLMFGPSLPYQYRLDGPHKWDGARNAIMTSNERMLWPLVKNKNIQKGLLQKALEFVQMLFHEFYNRFRY